MKELINEKINVLVSFTKDKVIPLSFFWGNKKYTVDKVNLVHATYSGREKIYYYSITSQNNFFKLCFNTDNSKWTIEEAYYGN
ncbi:hypothetical protein HOB30_02220 [Candidatus Falkowbacteria bacterium]|jgi:hypothetical protein|nr:hypothetical protein [Candidatus Falkowbacteria bacterium]